MNLIWIALVIAVKLILGGILLLASMLGIYFAFKKFYIVKAWIFKKDPNRRVEQRRELKIISSVSRRQGRDRRWG